MNPREDPICNIANCDERGRVFLMHDCVLREIPREHKDATMEVMETIKNNHLSGIISTTIHDDDQRKNLILKHKKVRYISYPSEWCALMLKDAALFHLELSETLFSNNLFLKDAHPWNILFEGGNPIFIDFTSIANQKSLFKETFLFSNTKKISGNTNSHISTIIDEIHHRMYTPYFIKPLETYFILGDGGYTRRLIEATTINTSNRTIRLRSSLFSAKNKALALINTARIIKSRANIKLASYRLKKDNNPIGFFQELRKQIEKIDVSPPTTGYVDYYDAKGENYCFKNVQAWNKKQLSVYDAINSTAIKTVVDIACNTGWFAILAAQLGKEVVAIDIDESCIEALYKVVKEKHLNLLPLVIDITKPTLDRPSIYGDGLILINTFQRLRSDAVIALGIIHHLSLGLGLELDEVLDLLTPLCQKILIIEFISLNDSLIQNEPQFFPAYFKNNSIAGNYNLEKLIFLCQQRGFNVRQAQSNPNTRTILVCTKWPENCDAL